MSMNSGWNIFIKHSIIAVVAAAVFASFPIEVVLLLVTEVQIQNIRKALQIALCDPGKIRFQSARYPI